MQPQSQPQSQPRWLSLLCAGGLLALDPVRGPTVWSCLMGSRCAGAPETLSTLVFGTPAKLMLATIMLGAACVWAYDRERVEARWIFWGVLGGFCVAVAPDVLPLLLRSADF